ncbi:MAG: CIA30 family protein [Gammaproteobacteria bacterium]
MLFIGQAAAGSQDLLTDFTAASPDLGWRIVNDNVMGGRSEGSLTAQSGEVLFRGSTNTNGGGFSSIRTAPLDLDLGAFDGIRVRILGDGRRYTWRLATDARWRGITIGYWAEFATTAGEWMDVAIAFSDFVPQVRGTRLRGPALDTRNISGMGLMIYDGNDGAFTLRLSSVHAYTATPTNLDAHLWKHRVLVLSAPSQEDQTLMAQLEQIEKTQSDFEDRDMMAVVVVDSEQSAAAQTLRDRFDFDSGQFELRLLGKDGGTKYSASTLTDINEIYALIDTMPMRQQEIDDPDGS